MYNYTMLTKFQSLNWIFHSIVDLRTLSAAYVGCASRAEQGRGGLGEES